jgi:hypothetical protein
MIIPAGKLPGAQGGDECRGWRPLGRWWLHLHLTNIRQILSVRVAAWVTAQVAFQEHLILRTGKDKTLATCAFLGAMYPIVSSPDQEPLKYA